MTCVAAVRPRVGAGPGVGASARGPRRAMGLGSTPRRRRRLGRSSGASGAVASGGGAVSTMVSPVGSGITRPARSGCAGRSAMRVGDQGDHEQHDDGGRGQRAELVLRLARPVVDDDRQRRVRAGEQVRDGAAARERAHDRAHEDQRGGLAEGPRQREHGPGQDAGGGGREDQAAGDLPARGAHAVARPRGSCWGRPAAPRSR